MFAHSNLASTQIQIVSPKLYEGDFYPSTDGSAAIDLRYLGDEPVSLYPMEEIIIDCGFRMAISPYAAALLLPRSGLGANRGVVLANLVGLIDSDYRGNVMVSLWYRRSEGPPLNIKPMERIAQMVVVPIIPPNHIQFTDDLPDTSRGSGGFGSTGRVQVVLD